MLDTQAILNDARRAAVAGAIGDAPDRPGQLVGARVIEGVRATVPSSSPLAAAIDGPGLFVLSRDGARRYSRRGDFEVDASGELRDTTGALVLGYRVDASGNPISGLTVCRVPPADVAAQRFAAYRLDERGVLFGDAERIDAKSGRRTTQSEPLARIAIANFSAPERMTRDGDVFVRATAASGAPTIGAPGESGRSILRVKSLDAGMVDLESDLRSLWAARRRLESQVAIAAASDRDTQTALGLVK